MCVDHVDITGDGGKASAALPCRAVNHEIILTVQWLINPNMYNVLDSINEVS